MFSSRLPPSAEPNAISRAVAALRDGGTPFVDLTESNPTRAGIPYPADLLQPLASPEALEYRPHPFGLASAREAVAVDYQRRGARVDPAHVVLSASTSESYSWLFKLLCDPGDCVLVPRPSYPLFEHLTRLEGVDAVPYALEHHVRWTIDLESVRAAPPRTRALLLVSPNNPTGSYISAAERAQLFAICAERGWAIVADEVFADYPLEVADPVTDLACDAAVLTFSLGGASKSLGLPQVKLGWTVVGGPPDVRDAALSGLELIADTFLSVGTPVQVATPALLRNAAPVRHAIHARVRANLARARTIAAAYPACSVLTVEGGWSTIVRVPAVRNEDTLVLELLEAARILVHPGYFYDLPHEAFLVVSLLPRDDLFADAFRQTLDFVSR